MRKTRLLHNLSKLGFGKNDAGLASKAMKYIVNVNTGEIMEDIDSYENNNNENKFIKLSSSPGTFSITPASKISSIAVASSDKVHGNIIDWGCGGGLLSILAAAKELNNKIIGLDYDEENIKQSIENARLNNNNNNVQFIKSDSFSPFDPKENEYINSLKGTIDCIIANPPASSNDDGFGYRRRIMKESIPFFKNGSTLLLQALSYYGENRFIEGAREASSSLSFYDDETFTEIEGEYVYNGVIASSPWVNLQGGYDLKQQLEQYVDEESKLNGKSYVCGPDNLTATEIYDQWISTNIIPQCKWQVHELVWNKKKMDY